ncbi:bifunctional [glutamine synthetase] adenylyltransferase/[glutamine synthetase]-adenylyl-L-tyrosine phosphorylase [Virgisporangium ochraceum]|uniref:Bifunctional glutamine synthetase adenylyltransferase/adenylyl-removing enzyme n=1 Tax=Virgisporangium ochraceum TaxID=65505 RepID=A0A8J3ZUN1_9ACTN|nr:bifunctional [glutamine synthetase] adenylyltransferase/[glutamine synthetase]-adenylyl-L-tyrosine phosphorylase [Virgisporangium ochraceum]GIJ68760.1 glutamate-ammonia-ligase adenylyltransferase [Virgisporangium ochraceum]
MRQLLRYGFRDARKAADRLGPDGPRLWDPAAGQPVDDNAGELLEVFASVADADLAAQQLQRLCEKAGDAPVTAAVADFAMWRRLLAVLGASTVLGDHLIANPDDWKLLGQPTNGGTLPPVDDVASLRLAYRRTLLRIVAADLTGAYQLEGAMAALSDLADSTLRAALAFASAERSAEAAACRLAVIAMGKCGGRELNYVSDVDVVFVAEPLTDDGDVEAAQRAGAVLAARTMTICATVAWPVDANLRPEGAHGPLTRTVASYVAYYTKWAKTWEFQALLKSRFAAGDRELGEEWLAAVQPFIWKAAERPEAVEDIRAMRRRIIDAIPRSEVDREIKRGPGGLRDIEFAVQLLQLVHGRADEKLRSPSTVEALRELAVGGYVGRADGEALLRAYRYLRMVEHRLQLQRLRRTHTVPADPDELRWLAQALGYRANAQRTAVEAFQSDWSTHATEVRRLHAKLLYRPLLEAVAKVPSQEMRMYPESAKARLEVLGFADPAGALRHIEALTGGVSRTAAIQRTLLPVLLSEFADAPEPDRGLLAYRQVSEKLGSTPWYLRLLRDEGPVALRLARLLALSRFLTDLLTRDPEALRLLADDAELSMRPMDFLATAKRHGGDPVKAVTAVRARRRRELFRIASADLLGLGDVNQVCEELAAVTDATLAGTLAAVDPGEVSFAIIGMGRLGSCEMNYPSDADVLFVYEPAPGTSDDRAAQAAHAAAEELRKLLTMPAPDPPLGIDADLRPEGRQGPLVRTLAAYEQYYGRWSKVWEAQALLRARFVAGDAALGERFLHLADRYRYPAGGLTREQVTEIRRIKARVDNERLPRGADPALHTKLGRGGLADVEWTVQLLQLRHGHEHTGLRTTRTLEALRAAASAGLLSTVDAAELEAAWVLATRVRNALTLVRGRQQDQLPRQGAEVAAVAQVLGRPASVTTGEFVDEYLRTMRRARQVVERTFDAG